MSRYPRRTCRLCSSFRAIPLGSSRHGDSLQSIGICHIASQSAAMFCTDPTLRSMLSFSFRRKGHLQIDLAGSEATDKRKLGSNSRSGAKLRKHERGNTSSILLPSSVDLRRLRVQDSGSARFHDRFCLKQAEASAHCTGADHRASQVA